MESCRTLVESCRTLADPTLHHDLSFLALLLFGLSISIWPLTHTDKLDELLKNAIDWKTRSQMGLYALSGLLGLVFGAGLGLVLVARRFGLPGLRRALETLATLGHFGVALPVIIYLAYPGLETAHPIMAMLLSTGVAVLITRGLSRFPSLTVRLSSRVASLLTWSTLLTMWGAYAFFMAGLAITNHHGLNTQIADLGYYDNVFWQSAHGNPLGCSFFKSGVHYAGHFDPILVLISPLYLLYPQAEFLLVFQPIWIGATAIPLFLLGRHVLGTRTAGLSLAALFLLHPAIHGVNLYEFHSLSMMLPVAATLVLAFMRRAWRLYFVALVTLLLVREDMALLATCLAVYGYATRGEGKRWPHITTAVVSLTWLLVTKGLVMPASDLMNCEPGGTCFAEYFKDMMPGKKGVREMLISALTNPGFALSYIFSSAKVQYVLLVLLPLGFLPLFLRWGPLLFLHGLAFTLLASRDAVFSIHFQYSCLLLGFGLPMLAPALLQLRQRPFIARLGFSPAHAQRHALTFLLCLTALLSWKFGAFVENQSFRGGFSRLVRQLSPDQLQNHRWIAEQAATVPEEARVSATRRMGAHISNRPFAYYFPRDKNAEYFFIYEGDFDTKEKRSAETFFKEKKAKTIARKGRLVLYRIDPNAVVAPATPAAPTPTSATAL